MEYVMIKLVVSAAALSFALVSAAWALPAAPRSELPTLNQSDIIQIGKKDRGHDGRRHGDYGGGKHYRGRSYHGGRYWGRRYYYRPYNWQVLGCILVGPVWYCP